MSTIEYEVPCVTLRGGVVVLAKPYKGDLSAVGYANRTQAERSAAKHPGASVYHPGRPFYVRLG